MKKTAMFITAILMTVFICCLGIFITNQKFEVFWNDIGKNTSNFEIYINPTTIKMDDNILIYQNLTSVAEKFNANLIKTDYIKENQSQILVKTVFLTHESVINNIPLKSGSNLKLDDMNSNNVIQTPNINNSKDCNSIGELYSFLNIQKIRIQPLFYFINNNKSAYGTYIVELKNTKDKPSFIKTLSNNLNSDEKSLTEQRSGSYSENINYLILATIIMFTSLLIFSLFTAHYIVQKFKTIGTNKLLGSSNFMIWKEIFIPIILSQIITLSVILIILRMLTNILQTDLFNIFLLGLLVIILTFCVSFLFFCIIKTYTISSLIKNKKPLKLMLFSNHIVRFISLLLVCIISVAISSEITNIFNNYKKIQKWDQYGNQFAVFKEKITDEDTQGWINKTSTRERKILKLYNKINPLGAVFIYYQKNKINESKFIVDYTEDDKPIYADYFEKNCIPDNLPEDIFTVNPNYFKNFSLWDVNGKLVKIDETEKKGIYILPDTLKNNKSTQSFFTALRKRNVEEDEMKFGTIQTDKKNCDAMIFYYHAGLKVFSFNDNVAEKSNYMLWDPIFSVMTEKNMLFSNMNFMRNTYFHSPIKIPINGTSAESVFDNYKEEIKNCGLDNNITDLISINSYFESEIESCKKTMTTNIIILILLFIFNFFISIETIKIMVKSNHKKLSAMKLLGYKFTDKYNYFLIPLLLLWIIQMIIVFTFIISSQKNTGFNIYPFLLVIGLFVLDMIIIITSLMHFDNKNTVESIKED